MVKPLTFCEPFSAIIVDKYIRMIMSNITRLGLDFMKAAINFDLPKMKVCAEEAGAEILRRMDDLLERIGGNYQPRMQTIPIQEYSPHPQRFPQSQ